ncbi:hypothetical protein BC828DRAFT_393739 [Blastocladiella britannica]|nr:hypothetical protein BC828DRAFT_393739 [Blastocladiella britannica]
MIISIWREIRITLKERSADVLFRHSTRLDATPVNMHGSPGGARRTGSARSRINSAEYDPSTMVLAQSPQSPLPQVHERLGSVAETEMDSYGQEQEQQQQAPPRIASHGHSGSRSSTRANSTRGSVVVANGNGASPAERQSLMPFSIASTAAAMIAQEAASAPPVPAAADAVFAPVRLNMTGWDVKSIGTQTVQSDLPATKAIESTLAHLQSDLDHHTSLLTAAAASHLSSHLAKARDALATHLASADAAAAVRADRARTAARVEATNTVGALDAAWAAECARIRSDAAEAMAELEQRARDDVMVARVAAHDAADQALAAKAQLAKVLAWARVHLAQSQLQQTIASSSSAQPTLASTMDLGTSLAVIGTLTPTNSYSGGGSGPPMSATAAVEAVRKAELEAEQFGNMVAELQRRIDTRDETISELEETIETLMLERGDGGGGLDHGRLLTPRLTVNGHRTTNSSALSLGMSTGRLALTPRMGSRADGLGSTAVIAGGGSEGGASRATTPTTPGGVGGDESNPNALPPNGEDMVAPGRYITDVELEAAFAERDAQTASKWTARQQKLKLKQDIELATVRAQLRTVHDQMAVLHRGVSAMSNPSSLAAILSRQRAVLGVSRAIVTASTLSSSDKGSVESMPLQQGDMPLPPPPPSLLPKKRVPSPQRSTSFPPAAPTTGSLGTLRNSTSRNSSQIGSTGLLQKAILGSSRAQTHESLQQQQQQKQGSKVRAPIPLKSKLRSGGNVSTSSGKLGQQRSSSRHLERSASVHGSSNNTNMASTASLSRLPR